MGLCGPHTFNQLPTGLGCLGLLLSAGAELVTFPAARGGTSYIGTDRHSFGLRWHHIAVV
ncbi:hypothetical protein A5671_07680 [Mycolicibacter heraklionensis]|nr:hypothetical protein A5671_07680 [Mycolicibacter heraklionensis]